MTASLTPMTADASTDATGATEPQPTAAQRKERTRARILDAALGLFAERGFHGTAVPLIAERAQVGAGSIYRHFESKEVLVNEVFRSAKSALLVCLELGHDPQAAPRAQFDHLWARLVVYAREQPLSFRFLEMQDHVPYLDEQSQRVELSVLAPIFVIAQGFQQQGIGSGAPTELLMAMVWGAFVGVMKYERLGYLVLDDARIETARDACWNLVSR